jgi:hypothetical protein
MPSSPASSPEETLADIARRIPPLNWTFFLATAPLRDYCFWPGDWRGLHICLNLRLNEPIQPRATRSDEDGATPAGG